MAANWHYAKGGDKHGPFTAAQLKELATTGQLSPDDLVWREDMKEWRKASTVKGLFPTQPPPPSGPPPVPSPRKKKSRKLLWLGAASLLVVGAVASWQLILRQDATADNEQGQTANDSRLDSGVGDQAATNTPESAPATSEASVVYLNGMDFGERPEIAPEAALTFRGRIFLPGGVRTHGEIREARYSFSPDSETIFMGANGRGAEHPIYAFDNRTGTLLSHIPKAHPRAKRSHLTVVSSPRAAVRE
jgi:hypothetical protein